MNKILMVPVHLDALYLSNSEAAAEPTADFRGLPYFDSQQGRDVNSDTPCLGDFSASPPFENSNMFLQAGVHLHWSLPDGLCRGKVIEGKIEMPAVPNRWLIRRRSPQTDSAGVKSWVMNSWVVESDYLWPPTEDAPAVNILHRSANTDIPYRFIGRKLTLEQWKQKDASSATNTDEYLEKLTAIGHGEPSFAAYYPNCMSVFGFHDPHPPKDWTAIQYDVIGWYGDGAISPPLSWQPGPSSEPSLVEPVRCWRADQGPQQLLCYASIKLTKGGPAGDSNAGAANAGQFKIAVGNTLSEALCAQLANEVADEFGDPALSIRIEEQLEAVHVENQLASQTQDLGPRLRHYRHRKSFDPVPGTERWTLHADQPGSADLPRTILSALRNLNQHQVRYRRQQSQLAHARGQLYGDWCNYMRCVYRPPDGGSGQFMDIDALVAYIESRSLEKVERLAGIVARTGVQLKVLKDGVDALIQQLNLAAAQDEETKQQNDLGTPARATLYELRAVPGTRYWQPTDPVVLISGGKIRHNERHGHDGRHAADGNLRCETYEIESTLEAELRSTERRDGLFSWMDTQWSPDRCIGFREVNVDQRPWNPLFLDWGIDMHPAESHAPDADTASYDPDIITGNYQLGSASPDLHVGILWTQDNPDRFSGRCLLAASSSKVLRERIQDLLRRQLLEGKPDTWAQPESGDQREAKYFKQVTDWYDNRPSKLPGTPAELSNLVDWYKERPVRGDAGSTAIRTIGDAELNAKARDPLYCTLLSYLKLFDNVDAATDTAASEPLRPRAFLGQMLSGYNGELIQWKRGLRLPIDEPVGLKACRDSAQQTDLTQRDLTQRDLTQRDFTQRVAEAVGEATTWTPEPTNNFSPIRSGALKLDRLRLLDSFGQTAEVPCDEQVIVPGPYRLPGRPGVAFLPPRLAQPARATFRWLDSHPDEPGEMIEAAARSPICGWLVAEKLSGRLLVFDSGGSPLGALATDNNTHTLEWVRAPGLPRLSDAQCEDGRRWLQRISRGYYDVAADPDPESSEARNQSQLRDLGELGASIDNPRLARVLLYLWATGSQAFLECFMHTLDDAMANIDPEGVTSMGSTALLMGRPVAVVGAELNLELKDPPAVRQDWTAFVLDQYRHRRDTDQFDQVRFPMRLGAYKSRNDGILGYWLEHNGGFVDDTFVAQAADDDEPSRALEHITSGQGLKARINAHGQGDQADDLNFTQSIADPPLQTTLLMDPRGQAQLTMGIMPVKRIDIPRSLWEPALEAIRVWFPAAPILTRPGSRRAPTPNLVDHHWSWFELDKTDQESIWQTLTARPSIDQTRLQKALDEVDSMLNAGVDADIAQLTARGWMLNADLPSISELIDKGWLQPRNPATHRLYLGTRKDRQPLNNPALEAPLDALLARHAVALISPGDEPDFNPGVEVREGWLQLEPGNGANS